jgi:hypothetical protein
MMRWIGLAVCLLAAAGCRESQESARLHYANPGGMWMPGQMNEHAQTLRSLGVENPHVFSDPMDYPLGAIVWLGGCSASFVSPEGLIATNYHCAYSTIQFHSSSERNLFQDGFLARNRQEELPGEIGKKVWVTQEIGDVTRVIRDGLETISDSLERYTEIERRIKEIITREERPEMGLRCEIKKYYEGEKYYLLKFLELKDIRLVYAPPERIGAFGGEIDNWHWPRHTGDFTFYRAYVSPSGKSAEYSPENVPYQPRHWLHVASEPLKEHDFVLVAGFPGRTQRLKTLDEILFTYEKDNPMRIRILREAADVYKSLAAQNEDLQIKVTPSLKGVMNSLQLLELVQENIIRADLIDEKIRRQTDFESWIAADGRRRRQWSTVLDEIARINEEHRQTYERDYLLHCIIHNVRLLDAANTIVRMAEERPLPDDLREPEYQERNWVRLAQSLERMQSSYDPAIDKAVLAYYLGRFSELPSEQKLALKGAVADADIQTPEGIKRFVDSLFSEALVLDDSQRRIEMFTNAATEDLQQSSDSFIQLALKLRSFTKEQEQRDKRYEGRMALLRPIYIQAWREYLGGPIAPDANGTLRVTFGTVKGYRPEPQASLYTPFTTLSQVVRKHSGDGLFDVPVKLREAANNVSGDMDFYDATLQDIPVNFLSDLDITGGNSGSATLNQKGEWVGLVFDGNSEGVASNLLFSPEITRAIHVDLRYILWVMKYVDHADNILYELGI